MPNNVSKLERTSGLGTSMVVGLSMVIPAYAATWMPSETWMQLQEDWPTYLFSASLALLVIGIAVKAVARGYARPADRKLRPPEPETDHSIGALRNSVLRRYLWGDR